MTESVTHEPAQLARVGAEFTIADKWRCRCGREHGWGIWAAAHFDEALNHTCTCGVHRVFKAGKVLSAKHPPTRRKEGQA